MVKRSRRQQKSKKQRSRKQRGGATYAVNQDPPIQTASGVPLAVNTQINPYCSWDLRQPPMIGGGGCSSCGSPMVGGGGGTGGYGFVLNNDLGKVYATTVNGPCPAQPVATPLRGGMAPIGYESTQIAASGSNIPPPGSDAALREIASYPSGYALGHPYSTKNESAHFLEPVRYDRSCMGGGRRRHHRSKKAKKSKSRSRQ